VSPLRSFLCKKGEKKKKGGKKDDVKLSILGHRYGLMFVWVMPLPQEKEGKRRRKGGKKEGRWSGANAWPLRTSVCDGLFPKKKKKKGALTAGDFLYVVYLSCGGRKKKKKGEEKGKKGT